MNDTPPPVPKTLVDSAFPKEVTHILAPNRGGMRAFTIEDADGKVTVLEGAVVASEDRPSSRKPARDCRRNLWDAKKLEPLTENPHLCTLKDSEGNFTSLSSAASFILGSPRSPKAWKVKAELTLEDFDALLAYYFPDDSTTIETEEEPTHTFKRKTVDAYAIWNGKKYSRTTVCAGSLITARITRVPVKIQALRETLLNDGTLRPLPGDPDLLILDKAQRFNSPSGAGAFVCGTSSQGTTEWIPIPEALPPAPPPRATHLLERGDLRAYATWNGHPTGTLTLLPGSQLATKESPEFPGPFKIRRQEDLRGGVLRHDPSNPMRLILNTMKPWSSSRAAAAFVLGEPCTDFSVWKAL